MFDAKHVLAIALAFALLIAGLANISHLYPKGFLGLELAPLTRAAQARAPFLTSGGALIVNVVRKSAADRAGLKTGEIVTAIDGRAVASAEEAADLINRKRSGERVSLRVYDVAQGTARVETIMAMLEPNPPRDTRVFHVDQPRTLARAPNFVPAMAANAAWAHRIARGAVTPFPLSRYEGKSCSALAPEGWAIVDDDGWTQFELASAGRHVKAIYQRARGSELDVVRLFARRLEIIFNGKPKMTAERSFEPDLHVIEFGTVNGYAGFAIFGSGDGDGNLTLRIVGVPASDAASLEPLAGAVALSIRCGSEPLTRASAAAPTSVSVKCLEGSCDEGDLAGAYNETLHVGYVHSATGENFMIDPRKDIWATGPNGPGTYRQVMGQLEKLEPGRTN